MAKNKNILHLPLPLSMFLFQLLSTKHYFQNNCDKRHCNYFANTFYPFRYLNITGGESVRTRDAQWSLFSSKFQTFGLGQTIWADKFWVIWGIFDLSISTNFGTVSFPLINQYFWSKSYIFMWDWDLNLGRKELGI